VALRVALLGSGWVADRHARAVLAQPEAELVAASSWREPSLAALAERHGIPRTTTDWRELAADPELDAVVVGTPNALHAEQSVAFLEAGKHVLVEKPMARNVAECDRMLAAAAGSTGRLMVAHCWRFHPDVLALRARVAAGELGAVVKTRSYGVHAGWGPSGWFTDPELAGGGALLDMGVHAIDTTRFLLGDPLPERVFATVATRYGDYPVDDDAVVLVRWSDATSSIIESGWWQPHLGGREADTELYCTGGYARVWDRTEPPPGTEHVNQAMFDAQMAEFVGAVASGRQPRPSGEDGRVVMEVVDRAYEVSRGELRFPLEAPPSA
jgi:predicted dehydrogenase